MDDDDARSAGAAHPAAECNTDDAEIIVGLLARLGAKERRQVRMLVESMVVGR